MRETSTKLIISIGVCLMLAPVPVAIFLNPVQPFSWQWCLAIGFPVLGVLLFATQARTGEAFNYSRDEKNLDTVRRFEELAFIRGGIKKNTE